MSRFPAERLEQANYTVFVEIPVLYGDLDTNHHINNVMMGRFFEHARYTANYRLREAEPELSFLVARVAIDYLSEGKFGPPMTIGTRFSRAGGKSLTLEQAAWQDGDRVVALGETVLVRMLDGRPAELPETLRTLLADS